MSLIKCPTCHNEVSDDAQSCPYCNQRLFYEKKRQQSSKRERLIALGVMTAIVALIWAAGSHSGSALNGNVISGHTESVLYRFYGGSDGSVPVGGLIMNHAGDLYGTTRDGGDANGDGTVFKLTPNGNGGWSESVLYRFRGGTGGEDPEDGLIMYSKGNLYGTAAGGIRDCPVGRGCGIVFELAPNGSGGYTESVIYRFRGGSNGEFPVGLIMDSGGDLYGTTSDGGGIRNCPLYDRECGIVFKLAPNSSGGYTESVIYRFRGGGDGWGPETRLTMGSGGNLYGTAAGGIRNCRLGIGCGVVFELAPNGRGGYRESVIYRFKRGRDGWSPLGRLIMDRARDLYGTAGFGGSSRNRECRRYGCGVVFKLTPDRDGAYTESVLYRFRGGRDGAGPKAGLIMDRAGDLYGTTVGGGGSSKCSDGCGIVFELAPNGSGGYAESVLYRFRGWSNGWSPQTHLTLDRAGNLYGTTDLGGNSTGNCSPAIAGCGVVYEIHLH